VIKRGFLDGYPGFYIAWATAFGAFVRYSRLYEEEWRREPPINRTRPSPQEKVEGEPPGEP